MKTFQKKKSYYLFSLLITITLQKHLFTTHKGAINYLSKKCSHLTYEKKLDLITAKKSVSEDSIQQQKIKDKRYTFLGKGGYSRVFYDEELKEVVKVIKARKLKSITSLRSVTEELIIGFEYFFKGRYLGTGKSCSFALKRSNENFDMIIIYMDLLKGYDMKFYIYDFQEKENLDLEQTCYTIKNLNYILSEFHDMGYFHRDIKPGNYFLLKDETSKDGFKPILIDFAFSLRENYNTRYKGTRKYMPKEMKVGDKKSDWYNNSIDVFNTNVTYMEYLYNFILDKQIDFSLAQILNGGLYDNWCKYYKDFELEEGEYNFKFVFCDNSDHYYEKFNNLESLVFFFRNKSKNYCLDREVENRKDIFWDNRENDLIKCFGIDKENQNFVIDCRPNMREAKKMFDLYFNWRFLGGKSMYKRYELIFENQRFFDSTKLIDNGFIGIMYRYFMPNLYRMLQSRHTFSTTSEEI